MANTKPKDKLLTDAHFAAFTRYVHKWQERLNLMDWRIVVSCKPARSTVMAEVYSIDLEARQAAIRVSRNWGINGDTSPAGLEDVALHEVLHVLVHEFKQFAGEDTVGADMMSAEHRVIQVLVCNLLGKKHGR